MQYAVDDTAYIAQRMAEIAEETRLAQYNSSYEQRRLVIETATGMEVDVLATAYGLERAPGESDGRLRARLLGNLAYLYTTK